MLYLKLTPLDLSNVNVLCKNKNQWIRNQELEPYLGVSSCNFRKILSNLKSKPMNVAHNNIAWKNKNV